MKKFIKTLAIMASLAMVLGFASCSDSDDDSGSNQTTTQKKSDLELAQAALSIDDEVAGDTITLPSAIAGYNDVTITWESSDSTIINISAEDGSVTVIQKAGTGVDTVTLTATLKEGEKTLTKTFTVKVYQASAELSNDKILELASAQVKSLLVAPAGAWGEVEFNETITIQSKNITVTLEVAKLNAGTTTETEDESVYIGDGFIELYRTLLDHTAKLNATYTIGTESKTEEISIVLPAITKFVETDESGSEILEFDPATKTFRFMESYEDDEDGTLTQGIQGTYVLDAENETMRVTTSKIQSSMLSLFLGSEDACETYYTRQQLLDAMGKMYKDIFASMKNFEENPTMTNAFEFYKQMQLFDEDSDEEFTDEDFAADFEEVTGVSYADKTADTYADAEARFLADTIIKDKGMQPYIFSRMGIAVGDFPYIGLATALKAYLDNQTVENAVKFMVAYDINRGNPAIANDYTTTGDDFLNSVRDTAASVKAGFIETLGLSENATTADILTAFNTAYNAHWTKVYAAVDAMNESEIGFLYHDNALCTYEINYYKDSNDEDSPFQASLNVRGIYDSSKKWYEQFGDYSSANGYISSSGIYVYATRTRYEFSQGEWNDAHTEFTWTPQRAIVGTTPQTKTFVFAAPVVTADGDVTITVTCGDATETYTFEGNDPFTIFK